jgi:hypothetical protein
MQLFPNLKNKLVNWIGSRLKPVRFFSDKEWSKMTSKEKLFITYKHHLFIIGCGESEVNVFEQLIMGMVPLATLLIVSGLGNYVFLVPILYIGLKGIKWKLGNWKDKKDFNALDCEIGNRRNKAMRKLMGYSQVFGDNNELKKTRNRKQIT